MVCTMVIKSLKSFQLKKIQVCAISDGCCKTWEFRTSFQEENFVPWNMGIESQSTNKDHELDQWRREHGSEKPQLATATTPQARSAWDCIYNNTTHGLRNPFYGLLELTTAKGFLFLYYTDPSDRCKITQSAEIHEHQSRNCEGSFWISGNSPGWGREKFGLH